MDLSWRLTYSEAEHGNPKNQTVILKDVQGDLPAGGCLPILGPSGAGKTSLLNVLGGKVSPTKFEGAVKLDGKPTSKLERTERISLVEQHDMFLDLLTIGEHMSFHANLRLHSLPDSSRKERVMKILEVLGLHKLYDRQIMVLSGGEKKRLSIAEELLNDPPVMILDEPTSQLDSHMAATVVETMQTLARDRRKTILFTIHQPSSALFQSFERVLFMAQGRVAYDGSPQELPLFLQGVGAPCPNNYSLAEWTMDQISQRDTAAVSAICDAAALRAKQQLKVADSSKSKLAAGFMESPSPREAGMDTYAVTYAPVWKEYVSIVKRTFIQRRRQRMQTRLNYLSTIVISVIAGAMFFGVGDDQASIRNRTGAVFFLFVHPVFSAIFETSMPLVMDAGTLLREYKNKRLYRVSSYYLARTTGELPIQASFPLLYCAIIYWMVYWRFGSVGQFVSLMLTIQLACFTGQSYGYMLSTLSTDFENMMVISIVFLVSIFMFSGMLIDVTTLPASLQWLSNISLFKHAFDAGIISVWHNLELRCDREDMCIFESGNEVLKSYNINPDEATAHLNASLVQLFCLSVAARIIGYMRIYARYVLEDDWRNLRGEDPDGKAAAMSKAMDKFSADEEPPTKPDVEAPLASI